MKTHHVTLVVASIFGLVAFAASCETKDRSLGTNSNPCDQVRQCQFVCPNGTINPTDSHGCVHTCECVTPTGGTGSGGTSGTGNTGGSGTGNTGGGGGGTSCDSIPQCEFLCPSGTRNPIDANGCEHTCECKTHQDLCPNEPACGSNCPPGTTSPTDRNGCITGCTCVPAPSTTDAGTGALKLYYTCGDPVCRGYTGGSGAALCTTEKVGDPCTVDGQKCDPQNDCNALVICASSDPTMKPGGCPISRRRYKEDIHYLRPNELTRYRDDLLAMKLATWRYKHDPSKERLGFMIDDNEGSAAVDGKRDLVDLYGYTSMAVATIQLQAQQIDALKSEIAAMKKQLAPLTRAKTNGKQ